MKIKFIHKATAVIMACICILYLCFSYIVIPANKKVDALNAQKEQLEAKSSDIEPLLKQKAELEEKRDMCFKEYDDIRFKKASNTATAEELLVFLGGAAEKNNTKVTGFSDLGTIQEDDGFYKSYYDIELSGSPFDIARTVQALNDMKIKYSVGSMSYRQDKEYDYLKRFFDTETDLPWYTEPEEEEDTLDIKEPESSETTTNNAPSDNSLDNTQQGSVLPPQSNNPPVIEKNEEVHGETEKPSRNEGTVLPDEEDKTIEDRLNDLLNISVSNNITYRVIPLNNVVYQEPLLYSNNMRLSFTICLTMFNEPSPDTSFIKLKPDADEEITEEADGVL